MPRAQIFISYRRDDAAGYARAVYDELARHFTAERVFMDVDDIGAGLAFDEVIRDAVGASEVLLVMIGKRWRGERDGRPARIEEADDFVRLEIAAGLARGMRVIPLLLDGAAMPTAAQLPAELRPLVRRNALEVGNTRFRADVDRLVATLREALGEPVATATRPKKRWWLGVAGGLVATAALIAIWHGRAPPRDGTATSTDSTPSAAAKAPQARRDINGEWTADVTYDWPNARYTERFVFGGEANELHGSASFLGVPRGLLEGSIEAEGLRFVTRTSELAGSSAETVHRYRGKLVGDEIRLVMQTEGGSSAHVPVEFTLRRTSAAAPATSR